jgi:hypothetical protein
MTCEPGFQKYFLGEADEASFAEFAIESHGFTRPLDFDFAGEIAREKNY